MANQNTKPATPGVVTVSSSTVDTNAVSTKVDTSNNRTDTGVGTVTYDKVVDGGIKSGTPVLNTNAKVGSTVTVEEVKKAQEAKLISAAGYSVSKDLAGLFERVTLSKNEVLINAIETIKTYMTDMAPNKILTDQVGAVNQVKLFRAIRSIVEYTDKDFQLGFVTLLKMFDEHAKGVFNERYVFRFTENIALSTDDRRAFERILNLIKITAPVQGRREAIKQVNMQKTLQYSFTDAGRNKINGFFER